MRSKNILIVSYPDDLHTKYVMDKLSLMGISHRLLNIGEYPSAFESAILLGESANPDISHLLGIGDSSTAQFTGVWWRRPLGAYRSEVKTMQEKYVASEAESFIRSLPNFIHGATWVSDPEATRVAGRKLQAAQYVETHKGQVCPASWEPGEDTLEPGLDLVGKI